MLVRKLVGGQAHGHPELCPVEVTGCWGKIKAARHHADDRICLAIEDDRVADDVRIAVITIQPQAVADDCYRFMRVLFLLRESTAEDKRNTERGENTRGEASAIHLFRSCAAGNLVACVDVASGFRETFQGSRIGSDLTSSDGNAGAISQMIS